MADQITQARDRAKRILQHLTCVESYVDCAIRQDFRFTEDDEWVPTPLDVGDEALTSFRETLANVHQSASALADCLDVESVESALSAANPTATIVGTGTNRFSDTSFTRLALRLAEHVLSWADVGVYRDCTPTDESATEFAWGLSKGWDLDYLELEINIGKECDRVFSGQGNRADSADKLNFFPQGLPEDPEVVAVVAMLFSSKGDHLSLAKTRSPLLFKTLRRSLCDWKPG
jgi:hypothetical protein